MNEKNRYNDLQEISRKMAEEYGLDIRMDEFPGEGNYTKVPVHDDLEEEKELRELLKERGIGDIHAVFDIPEEDQEHNVSNESKKPIGGHYHHT